MKINITEVKASDTVIVSIGIGTMAPNKVNDFCEKTIRSLKEGFKCKILGFPTRYVDGFEFTLIRHI
jgi:hypothetical protein